MTGFEGKEEKLPGVNESRRALNFESACQWVGLALLLAIIIAAVLGIFSNGYFSSANAVNSAQTLRVNYERFGRLQTEYKIELTAKKVTSEQIIFRLGGDFNTAFQQGSITPQPDHMFSRDNALYLVYDNVKAQEAFPVWIYITPVQPGKRVNTFGVNNEPALSVWQFIYP